MRRELTVFLLVGICLFVLATVVNAVTTTYYSTEDPGTTRPPTDPPWKKVGVGGVPLPDAVGGSVWIGRDNLRLLPQKEYTVVIGGPDRHKAGLGSVHGYLADSVVTEVTSGCTGIKDVPGPPPTRRFTFIYKPQPDWEVMEIRRIGALGDCGNAADIIEVTSYSHCSLWTTYDDSVSIQGFHGLPPYDTLMITEVSIFPAQVPVDPAGAHAFTAPETTGNWTSDIVYVDPEGNSRPAGGVRWTSDGQGLGAGKLYGMTIHMLGSADSTYSYFALDADVGEYQSFTFCPLDTGSAVDWRMPLEREIMVHPNVPNPFTARTMVGFEMPEKSWVRVSVYDVSGKLIRELESGSSLEAGHHEVTWDGKDGSGESVAPGIYFCRFEAGRHRKTRRVVLIR